MNKKTLSAILMGVALLLGVIVLFLSIRIALKDKEKTDSLQEEIALQEEETQIEEAEVIEEETQVIPEVETKIITMIKTTDTVNVRSGPGTEYSKLGQAVKGSEFVLIEAEENGWSRVDYNGTEAYIKSDYVNQFEIEVEVEPEAESTEEDAEDSGSGIDPQVTLDMDI